MLGAFRSAHAEPRSAAARIGLVALLACVGLTWTAGASSAFATYGTVKITKINEGGDQADPFHFNASTGISAAGGFDLKGGQTYANAKVHANAGAYNAAAYTVAEPASDKYELKSIVCNVTPAPYKTQYGSTSPYGATGVNIKVGVGETAACTFTNKRKTGTITVKKQLVPATDAGKFDLKVDGKNVATQVGDGGYGSTTVPTGTHTVDEYGTNLADYVRYTTCAKGTTVVAEGSGALNVPVGANDQITCTVKNVRRQPGIQIVKSGPATAYSGDTLSFGFDVSNTGNRPLHDIQVSDDHCSPVVGPVAKTNGNADDTLDPGETWRYTCSYVATHALGDLNPVTNVAKAQGRDDQDTKVEDDDSHNTLFLHPAIDIEKSGPATATAGALLAYSLDVTNPGDMPFAAADVAVTDAKCKAAPALQSTNDDATPGTLNPGDRWTYTCQVQTAAGQTSVVNVADVKGTDENARVVTDEDSFTTTLTQPAPPSIPTPPSTPVTPQSAPAQQVAGVTATSRSARGTAALRGPRACPRTGTVAATVTGRQIRRVTFFVGGKKVKTVTKADRNGRWTLNVRTGSLRRGANAVVARVEFTAASRTRTRSLRITVTRCAAQAVQPQFTG
ncbi:MAG: hypothetical protein QOH46_2651 [Solirubrobacteraceae bacterium]|jgi:hypothetical protein|nr:hypothetical protein [Solirubrobacteraceae bacterium]